MYVTISIPVSSGVNYEYDYLTASGSCSPTDYSIPSRELQLQAVTIGDALGINPKEVKEGLIAWHPLDEHGSVFRDQSKTLPRIDAYEVGNTDSVVGRYRDARSPYSSGPPYGHIISAIPSQDDKYMCSFWFRPTITLTSGSQYYFTIMESDAFYGDDFREYHNHLSFAQNKGWDLVGDPDICEVGYEGDFLRLKGNDYTDWFGPTWTASTLFFDINKDLDWDIETKVTLTGSLDYGGSFGMIFFNSISFLDYCSISIRADSIQEYQLINSSLPYMVASDSPAPYVVDESSYRYNSSNYKAWHTFEDPDTSWGGNYFLSNQGSLPEWVRIYLGYSTQKIIQGYRLRRRSSYFPVDWEFQASNNGSDWTTLHTMVNQPDPGEGNWTGWFSFSNETTYPYYRFYITDSQNGSYVGWDGTEFIVKEKSPLTIDGNVAIRTRDLEYIVDEHMTTSGTWYLYMYKRGDNLRFYYKHESTNWQQSVYYVDSSLWSDSMRIGLQSNNSVGESPDVLFDYLWFRAGLKPDTMGDPEEPGRIKVMYNKVDAQGIVEDRTDSRLWLMTSRDGFAYGTSTYHWEPNEWYLLQFGFTSNADPGDYVWWVNGTQERGLVVGSGIGSDFVMVSGGLSYFDQSMHPTYSGTFILDEVSHWNRWLTAEEILRMINKVSQSAWHYSHSYLDTYDTLLSLYTTLSGGSSAYGSQEDLNFYYFTQYQSPQLPQKEVEIEKVSYRIQKDFKQLSFILDEVVLSIMRGSSGWVGLDQCCYAMGPLGPENFSDFSSNSVYGNYIPENLFDNQDDTAYLSGADPSSSDVFLMFNYERPWTRWLAIRFQSRDTSWVSGFPNRIEIYCSNKSSPTIDDEDDWVYKFDIICGDITGPSEWCNWVEFPADGLVAQHYRLRFVDTQGGGRVGIAAMEILVGPFLDETLYSKMEVRGDISVGLHPLEFPNTYVVEILNSKTKEVDVSPLLITHSGVSGMYSTPQYAMYRPVFSDMSPSYNQRMIHPELLWFPDDLMYWDIRSFGVDLNSKNNKMWIKRKTPGQYTNSIFDNFCFYSLDFLEASGIDLGFGLDYGEWNAVNQNNAYELCINKDFASRIYVDNSVSGTDLITTTGMQNTLYHMDRSTYHLDPRCYLDGTKSLRMSVSGELHWDLDQQDAPFIFWNITNSGTSGWEILTKIRSEGIGWRGAHKAGLMVVDPNDPTNFVQVLTVSGAIQAISSSGIQDSFMEAPIIPTDLEQSDPIWLKLRRRSIGKPTYEAYWSANNNSWNRVDIFSGLSNVMPTMSGAVDPPYEISSTSYVVGWEAWHVTSSDGWKTDDALPQSIEWDLSGNQKILYYRLQALDQSDYYERKFPFAFSLEGSTNGVTWDLLDTRTEVYDPQSNSFTKYFTVSAPGWYRYYRLNLNMSTEGTTGAALQKIETLGLNNIELDDDEVSIGIVGILDTRKSLVSINDSSYVPAMTSNSEPSPWEVWSPWDNSEVYRVFDDDPGTRWDTSRPYVYSPKWFGIDAGVSNEWELGAFRTQGGGHYTGEPIILQGSNDNAVWYTIHQEIDIPNDGWSSLLFIDTFNRGVYRYYRMVILGSNSSVYVYGFDPRGIIHDGITFSGVSATYIADYFYFKSDDNTISGVENKGDGWELILDGTQVLNSTNNTGITQYTDLYSYKDRIIYQLVDSFEHGENFYIRTYSEDLSTFKLTPDTDDYIVYLSGDMDNSIVIDSRIEGLDDLNLADNGIEINSTAVTISPDIIYQGMGSFYFNGASDLYTSSLDSFINISDDWCIHFWARQTPSSGNLFSFRVGSDDIICLDSFDNELHLKSMWESNPLITTEFNNNSWTHIGLQQKNSYLMLYVDGVQYSITENLPNYTDLSLSGSLSLHLGHSGYTGCLDQIILLDYAKFSGNLLSPNIMDELVLFSVVDWSDFEVSVDVVDDVDAPIVIPQFPLPGTSGICPASGIKFEVLDDYTGVDWDDTIITIDNITVWSGGNNMTEWYDDRGTLIYEDLGQQDGEWADSQLTESGIVYTDGINRLLYPPGTVYSGSGAWGRRFTYNISDDTEITYFDYTMNITITGSDQRGNLSLVDSRESNIFGYDYSFDFITNSNIRFGEFFLDVGEAERIDILRAKNKILYVDLWDSDYPETDIDEDACYIRFYDGVHDFVCSGTWFTTYTGTTGTTSGIRVHRFYYDAEDYYWDGHRTMNFEVQAQNNNPKCGVYNRNTYQLLYGWRVFWLHDSRILPFEFDKKLPVFVSIKTQDFIPSRYSKSYMLWTAPAMTYDFGANIRALPLGDDNNIEVDLIADSHYLQYSEDVEVEVSCQDRDGNELVYKWTFRTEDKPGN